MVGPSIRGSLRRDHSTLVIGRHAHDAFASEAEQAQSLQQADVHFLADHDCDWRRAEQSLRFDIPAVGAQH
jgi:hypothetical protein